MKRTQYGVRIVVNPGIIVFEGAPSGYFITRHGADEHARIINGSLYIIGLSRELKAEVFEVEFEVEA